MYALQTYLFTFEYLYVRSLLFTQRFSHLLTYLFTYYVLFCSMAVFANM